MKLHVLPGDAFKENFKRTGIEGEVAVCRECLIEGDINAGSLQEFWNVREQFLTQTYPDSESTYEKDVVAEFQKIINLPEDSEINLWFEYELFCQVNMWFCLDLLRNSKANVYRVEPVVRNGDDIWKGFGGLDVNELNDCFQSRKSFSFADINLASDLWNAYRTGDNAKLKLLSGYDSPCFPYMKEVCMAAIEKDTRPKEILKEISHGGEKGFEQIFQEFARMAGVYGFGDSQVKRMLENI